MKIYVLGSGCAKCNQTEKTVREAVETTGVAADIEKISDVVEIVKMGVMSTPAVIIDGKIVSTGRVPSINQVVQWIENV